MRERDGCPNRNEDCDFSDVNELALTRKIMEAISRFSQDEQITPCPLCLRDTMLTVAALLHLEGMKISRAHRAHTSKRANDEFTQAGRQRLKAVIDADAIRIASDKH
ncbi:MAG: hypothetical protein WBX25_08905 [Rhodomicrobium sp.]